MTPVEIKKQNGNEEPFDEEKLTQSLLRSGMGEIEAQKILRKIKKKLYPGISTKEIYRYAFNNLKKRSKNYAATYSLKKAILAFGPSGYFFEKFVCAIFKELGYETDIGKIYRGKCISHEVDVVAKNDRHTFFMECKFHNASNKKNDVKTALYVHARHLDLKEGVQTPDFDDFYLISNTTFTKDAMEYSQCAGLKLIGLNSPEGQALHDIIRTSKLHPLTCLKKMRVRDKTKMMEEGHMLCKEVWDQPESLDILHLSVSEKRAILNEIRSILIMPEGQHKKVSSS